MRIQPINNTYNSYLRPQSFNQLAVSSPNVSFQKKQLTNVLPKTTKKGLNILKKMPYLLILLGLFCLGRQNFKQALKDAGYVEPIESNFKTKEDALKYGIGRVVEPLNTDPAYEYSVIIDYNNYSIVSERKGDEHSVTNYPPHYVLKDILGIKHPYIQLHGHPENAYSKNDKLYTQTFSAQDFRAFNASDDYKESYVLNKRGQYSVFVKKDNYKQLTDEEVQKVEIEYLKEFESCWANTVKVYKDGEVVHTFNDQQGVHRFWKKMADKYNFEYFTTYGTFDGIDVYKNSFYPEYEDK